MAPASQEVRQSRSGARVRPLDRGLWGRFTELERRHLKRIRYAEPDQTMAEEIAIA